MWRSLLLILLLPVLAGPGLADETRARKLDRLFASLAAADRASAPAIAEDIWAAWLESGSPTVDLLMRRGLLAQERGELSAARDFYTAAIRLDPGYAEAWHRRASVYMQDNDPRAALADLGEALTREPRHFGALAGLGEIMEQLEKKAAALEAYRSALKIYPLMEEARAGAARLEPALDGRPL